KVIVNISNVNDHFGGLFLCHDQDRLNTLNSLNIY
ncbi:MAG: hypothetical protein ACI9YH_005262, partial [Colwellia sp.]